VSIDDSCARENVFEVSLSKRLLAREQMKEISYQLLNNSKSNNTKMETRLCIRHVDVDKWLCPARSIGERKIIQNNYKFSDNRHASICKAIRLAGFVEDLSAKLNYLNITQTKIFTEARGIFPCE
jgi:hypothetical protein